MPQSTSDRFVRRPLRAPRRTAPAAASALAFLAIPLVLAAEPAGIGVVTLPPEGPPATAWLGQGARVPSCSIVAFSSDPPDRDGSARAFLLPPPGRRGWAPLRTPASWGFGRDFLQRMEREARRVRLDPQHGLPGADELPDPGVESQRAEAAQRIFSRSFRRTLDGHLESLARSSDRLGGAIAWLENFGSWQLRGPASPAAGPPSDGTPPERDPGAAQAGLGIRLDAHPRLLLRLSALSFQGRIEVPLFGQAPRLSLERPLGAFGRARLTSGRDRLSGAWTTLCLSFTY